MVILNNPLVVAVTAVVVGAAATYYFMVWKAKGRRKVIHWITFPPTKVMEVAQQVAGSIKFKEHTIQQLVKYVFQIKNAGHDHIEGPGQQPLTWTPPQPESDSAKTPVLLVADVLRWTPRTAPRPTIDYEELGSELTISWKILNPRDCVEIEVICDCEEDGVGNLVGLFPGATIVPKPRLYSENADDDTRRSIRHRVWAGIVSGTTVGVFGTGLIMRESNLLDSDPYYFWLSFVSYGIIILTTYGVYHAARLGKRRQNGARE